MDTYAHIMPTLQQDAAQQMNAIRPEPRAPPGKYRTLE
jgi:hypothetical protein